MQSEEERFLEIRRGIRVDEHFAWLQGRYAAWLTNLFRRQRAPESEVGDLVQLVFLRIHQGIENFEGRSQPRTWIKRIAVNVMQNWRRDRDRQKRKGETVELDESVHDAGLASDSSPAWQTTKALDRVLVAEKRRALRDAIAQLTPKLQEVVTLHLDGRSDQEIATLLKIPEGTVKSRLHAAKRKLREYMGGPNSEGNEGG